MTCLFLSLCTELGGIQYKSIDFVSFFFFNCWIVVKEKKNRGEESVSLFRDKKFLSLRLSYPKGGYWFPQRWWEWNTVCCWVLNFLWSDGGCFFLYLTKCENVKFWYWSLFLYIANSNGNWKFTEIQWWILGHRLRIGNSVTHFKNVM